MSEFGSRLLVSLAILGRLLASACWVARGSRGTVRPVALVRVVARVVAFSQQSGQAQDERPETYPYTDEKKRWARIELGIRPDPRKHRDHDREGGLDSALIRATQATRTRSHGAAL